MASSASQWYYFILFKKKKIGFCRNLFSSIAMAYPFPLAREGRWREQAEVLRGLFGCGEELRVMESKFGAFEERFRVCTVKVTNMAVATFHCFLWIRIVKIDCDFYKFIYWFFHVLHFWDWNRKIQTFYNPYSRCKGRRRFQITDVVIEGKRLREGHKVYEKD